MAYSFLIIIFTHFICSAVVSLNQGYLVMLLLQVSRHTCRAIFVSKKLFISTIFLEYFLCCCQNNDIFCQLRHFINICIQIS